MAPSLNVCTSGRSIRGVVEKHDPCGHVLYLIGHTGKRRVPVEVCPACDGADQMPAVREMRAS